MDDQGASPRARPIRVAFCIDNMNVGGTELNAVRTAERLDPARVSVRVATLQSQGPLLDRYRDAGIEVRSFPLRNLYGAAAARQGLALARWLREERVSILHAHDIYSNVFGVMWGRMAGARTIASRRWWEGYPQMHWRLAARWGYGLADAALANSEAVVALLLREGVTPAKISVVPNFLDDHAFEVPADYRLQELRAGIGLRPEDRAIGIVANLLPIKDHATLMRAFARLAAARPAVRLVLVGDGPERSRLQELSAALGITERVVFAGRRSNDPNLHHLFEISVLCSVSEGLPNSVLEAMAAGRPVVATRVGAAGDAVLDGVTGSLVPTGDDAALTGALRALLDDPARARAMGDAGRQRAREKYSPESALRALEQLYGRLAGVPGAQFSDLAASGAAAIPSPALR